MSTARGGLGVPAPLGGGVPEATDGAGGRLCCPGQRGAVLRRGRWSPRRRASHLHHAEGGSAVVVFSTAPSTSYCSVADHFKSSEGAISSNSGGDAEDDGGTSAKMDFYRAQATWTSAAGSSGAGRPEDDPRSTGGVVVKQGVCYHAVHRTSATGGCSAIPVGGPGRFVRQEFGGGLAQE